MTDKKDSANLQPAPKVVVLPQWWEVCTDTKGRIYYKNNYKKTTSWTAPTMKQIALETQEQRAQEGGFVDDLGPPPAFDENIPAFDENIAAFDEIDYTTQMEGVTTQMGNRNRKVAVVLSILAFACIAACIGGQEWLSDEWSTMGLWQSCYEYEGWYEWECGEIEEVDSTLKAVRAFIVISTISSIVNIGLAIMVLNGQSTKLRIASLFQFVTAGSVIIGLIIFTAEDKEELLWGYWYSQWHMEYWQWQYGWSFYIGWVGMFFAAIGGCCGRIQRL